MTGEEASGVEEPIHEEASGVEEASAVQKPIHGELTNEERYGIYFALMVIKTQNGQVLKKDKEVIASLLDTTVRTVERIWERALKQIEQGRKLMSQIKSQVELAASGKIWICRGW